MNEKIQLTEQLIMRARSDGATMVAEQQTEAKP